MEKNAASVVSMIRAIPDDSIKRIFVARYLNKLKWEEIADATFTSVSQAQRLHKKGLQWLEVNYKL